MDTHEWLEAYFDHSIVEVQRRELEAQAHEDPALAHMLTTQRNALIGLEALGEEKLRMELNRMLGDWQELKEKRRVRQLRVGMLVGTLFIVASLVGWFGWRKLRTDSAFTTNTIANTDKDRLPEPQAIQTSQPQALALTYFEMSPIQLKGLMNKHKTKGDEAMQLISEQKYAEAIAIMESMAGEYRKVPESLQIILGMSYLADEQPADAVRSMLPLMYGTSTFDDEARWYLSLAYFRQGNIVQGMGLMEEVRRHEGHFNQEAAQRFLGQLKGETGI